MPLQHYDYLVKMDTEFFDLCNNWYHLTMLKLFKTNRWRHRAISEGHTKSQNGIINVKPQPQTHTRPSSLYLALIMSLP
jgi:hypothetical protein